MRVRIIYISWVKSYNYPYTVFNIHKCFHFKWNKFSPKYCEICKFYRISCNARMFEFYTNSQKILMQKKLELLIRLSGTQYPTANLYFHGVWKIHFRILEEMEDDDIVISDMAKIMKENFDKYWDCYSIVLSFAVILDP